MAIDTLRAPTGEIPAPTLPARALLATERLRLTNVTVAAIVFALVLVSLWLRTRAIHLHYWVDEGLSVGIASHPLSDIPGLLRQDGSPPLYYLLLHIWMSWRGSGEVATHELSLIFALLTIPVAYWGGSSLFDRRAGICCAVLGAGAYYLTGYGQETRMYSLLALLSLLVALSFVEVFVRRRRRYLPVFVASLAASLYTHNWALFLGLMTGLAFLWCLHEYPAERRALIRDGLIGFGAVAVLYAPWLPTLIYQAQHTGAPWDLPPNVWSLTTAGYFLSGGRGAAVALLLGGGTGIVALWQNGNGQPWLKQGMKTLLLLGVGTMLIAWVYSKLHPAWAPRYLAVIVGPILLLFGVGLARGGRLAVFALALVCCFWVLDPRQSAKDTKSNVAAAVAKVRHTFGTDPLVLSTQPEDVPTIEFYVHRPARYGSPLGPSRDPRVVDWRDALTKLKHSSVSRTLEPMLSTVSSGQRVVLVFPLRLPSEPLWMRLINRASNRWAYALEHSHGFKLIATNAAKAGVAGVPVRVSVFEAR
jgi:hypothetical protein